MPLPVASAVFTEGCVPKIAVLPDVVTADEAAKYLRVSKATLLRLSGKKLILGVKIGRQWRFSKEAILNLLNNPDWLQKIGSGA